MPSFSNRTVLSLMIMDSISTRSDATCETETSIASEIARADKRQSFSPTPFLLGHGNRESTVKGCEVKQDAKQGKRNILQ